MRRLILSILLLLLAVPASAQEAVEQHHPAYPVIEGYYQMTPEWGITLPGKFNQRFEVGKLVLWRPGLTLWVSVWYDDPKTPEKERLDKLMERVPEQAYDRETTEEEGLFRHCYWAPDAMGMGRQPEFHGFALGWPGHLRLCFQFEDPAQAQVAETIWKSLVLTQ